MYRMKNLVEILLGLLLVFLVIGQPRRIRVYTRTTMGKIVFLAATIGGGFYSLYAGLLIALIYIVLRKDFMLVEGMENSETKSATNTDFVKKYCKDGKVDQSLNPPTLKYTTQKCNPCDDDCEFEITSAKEQLTVDEALRPKESNSIPV